MQREHNRNNALFKRLKGKVKKQKKKKEKDEVYQAEKREKAFQIREYRSMAWETEAVLPNN